jgi:hypothetical protein
MENPYCQLAAKKESGERAPLTSSAQIFVGVPSLAAEAPSDEKAIAVAERLKGYFLRIDR